MFIVGLIILAILIIKDECIKDVTANGDFDIDKAYYDAFRVSKKELNRRTKNGYYNTGKKK